MLKRIMHTVHGEEPAELLRRLRVASIRKRRFLQDVLRDSFGGAGHFGACRFPFIWQRLHVARATSSRKHAMVRHGRVGNHDAQHA